MSLCEFQLGGSVKTERLDNTPGWASSGPPQQILIRLDTGYVRRQDKNSEWPGNSDYRPTSLTRKFPGLRQPGEAQKAVLNWENCMPHNFRRGFWIDPHSTVCDYFNELVPLPEKKASEKIVKGKRHNWIHLVQTKGMLYRTGKTLKCAVFSFTEDGRPFVLETKDLHWFPGGNIPWEEIPRDGDMVDSPELVWMVELVVLWIRMKMGEEYRPFPLLGQRIWPEKRGVDIQPATLVGVTAEWRARHHIPEFLKGPIGRMHQAQGFSGWIPGMPKMEIKKPDEWGLPRWDPVEDGMFTKWVDEKNLEKPRNYLPHLIFMTPNKACKVDEDAFRRETCRAPLPVTFYSPSEDSDEESDEERRGQKRRRGSRSEGSCKRCATPLRRRALRPKVQLINPFPKVNSRDMDVEKVKRCEAYSDITSSEENDSATLLGGGKKTFPVECHPRGAWNWKSPGLQLLLPRGLCELPNIPEQPFEEAERSTLPCTPASPPPADQGVLPADPPRVWTQPTKEEEFEVPVTPWSQFTTGDPTWPKKEGEDSHDIDLVWWLKDYGLFSSSDSAEGDSGATTDSVVKPEDWMSGLDENGNMLEETFKQENEEPQETAV